MLTRPFDSYLPPSLDHWFGTDKFGRDVFARVLAESRTVIIIAPLAAAVSVLVGGLIGFCAGYFQGFVDDVLSRGCPPEVNDDEILNSTVASLERQFGESALIECPGDYGIEDFAYFTEPSAHSFVGSSQPGRSDRVHNTDYQPDERCIGFGVVALTRTAIDLLT